MLEKSNYGYVINGDWGNSCPDSVYYQSSY